MFKPDSDALASSLIRPFNVTHRMVLTIAIPMTLAGMTTPLLGLVDTGVIGQLGNAAMLGGLAMGALVFDCLFSIFGFLRSGTTGLVAQAMGRGDRSEENVVFWRAIIVALLAGFLMIALLPLVLYATNDVLKPAPETAKALNTYVSIRMLSAPMALVNFSVLGLLLGRGKGLFGLALQFLLNGINIILALILGLGLGWDVSGVAWATVTGETVAAIMGVTVLIWRGGALRNLDINRLFDKAGLWRMIVISRDIMIRSVLLMSTYVFFARVGNELGTITLAANAVLMNFYLVVGFFLEGVTIAAEQLAGRAVGARYSPAFRRSIQLTFLWGMVLATLMGLIFLMWGDLLVNVLTTEPDVRLMAVQYLPWVSLTALTGLYAFQMDSIFIGASWSKDMRNMMFLSMFVFFGVLYGTRDWLGNHSLWLALNLFLFIRGVTLSAMLPKRYRGEFSSL
ncbi:MATE family efflux transporter [Pseudochrobactrum sp. MP213Fo]|uniref:MATE family efflux transporter n=1 Tax=Pseudochrobactrum sp. MP213Fo TaxID=3022250 RepID=UPI003B9FB8C7